MEDHHVAASAGAGRPSSTVKESHVEEMCAQGSGPGAWWPVTRDPDVLPRSLALGLPACQLFNLFLLCATRLGPLGFGSGLLAGGALYLLAFFLVFNLGCVCQC